MLYALGFVSFFIAGGLTGPILAQPILDQYLHNTYFVVAHFHLIMAMAGIFGLFAATAYWFPQISSAGGGPRRLMNETLARWHFGLSVGFAYATFLPMHLAGLAGEPRHYQRLDGIANAASDLLAHSLPIQRAVSISAFILASTQLLFLLNLFLSLRRGALAPRKSLVRHYPRMGATICVERTDSGVPPTLRVLFHLHQHRDEPTVVRRRQTGVSCPQRPPVPPRR